MTKHTLLHHLSSIGSTRLVPPFIKVDTLGRLPGTIGFLGEPATGYFPIASIDVKYRDSPFSDTTLSHTIGLDDDDDTVGLGTALNYDFSSNGFPQLRSFLTRLTQFLDRPATSDWDLVVTNGSGNALAMLADVLINPGDVVLCEEFTFVITLDPFRERGATIVPIPLRDELGLDVDYLEQELVHWETRHPGLRRPKALITVPTGQNPTGSNQLPALRRDVYRLASAHDLLIIEDDPYGLLQYLQFPDSEQRSDRVDAFVEHQNAVSPLYLSSDTEGRVLRVATFLKVFAPGFRMGYIVASPVFADALKKYNSLVTKGFLGALVVLFMHSLKHWAAQFQHTSDPMVYGWLGWVLKMRDEYLRRRDLLRDVLESTAVVKSGGVSLLAPAAGMFFAARVNFAHKGPYLEDTVRLQHQMLAHRVFAALCRDLAVDMNFSADRVNVIRLLMASATSDEELVEAAQRWAAAAEATLASTP